MTPELRLMVAPATTYARLARDPSPVGPLTALRRPLLAAIVLGTSIAIGATGHVTPALVVSTTVCWSFAIALQIAIALALIAGPARRTVGVPRALDLLFASHAPWSLWLLAAAAVPAPLGQPPTPLLWFALVPLVLTVRMVAAFFGQVLDMDPLHAVTRTAIHQGITWSVFVLLYSVAVAIHPRIVEWLAQ